MCVCGVCMVWCMYVYIQMCVWYVWCGAWCVVCMWCVCGMVHTCMCMYMWYVVHMYVVCVVCGGCGVCVYVCGVCDECMWYVWCVCMVCPCVWCVWFDMVCICVHTCVCGVHDVYMVEHEETSLRRALEDKQSSRVGVEGVGWQGGS